MKTAMRTDFRTQRLVQRGGKLMAWLEPTDPMAGFSSGSTGGQSVCHRTFARALFGIKSSLIQIKTFPVMAVREFCRKRLPRSGFHSGKRQTDTRFRQIPCSFPC